MNDPVTLLQSALVVVGALALLLWAIPGPCKCEKCGFHVNERRMAEAHQRDLQHDYQHKTFGDCSNEGCDRNRSGRIDS
jgi:hypothetical protein